MALEAAKRAAAQEDVDALKVLVVEHPALLPYFIRRQEGSAVGVMVDALYDQQKLVERKGKTSLLNEAVISNNGSISGKRIVFRLLEKGLDPLVVDAKGECPVSLAIKLERFETIEILLHYSKPVIFEGDCPYERLFEFWVSRVGWYQRNKEPVPRYFLDRLAWLEKFTKEVMLPKVRSRKVEEGVSLALLVPGINQRVQEAGSLTGRSVVFTDADPDPSYF